MSRLHNYYVYIMTNKHKTVVYTGVTSNIQRRVYEHENGLLKGFTKKYNAHYLVYYEHYTQILEAIAREKQIKKWRREKKNNLIASLNPDWEFLNDKIADIL